MATINTTPTVTIDELRTLIPAISKQVTVLVQSEPGCGKTSLLKMLKEDMGDAEYDYIYVDCPAKDMSDIAMAIPDRDTKTLEHYVGALFKMNSGKKKVILLDEVLKTPKMMQIIYTRLMLERYIGDTPLPEGSMVFATSNNTSDGVGDAMMAHVGNRVCIVKMQKPNATQWNIWARDNAISRAIRAWVTMYPRCLRSYTEGDQDDNPYIFHPNKPVLSFVSPRSLAMSDTVVRQRDLFGETVTMAALAGIIGASAAGDMAAYLSMDRQLPPLEEFIKNPTTITMPEEVGALMMVILNATDVITTQDELTSFMHFVNRIPNSELSAVFFTMMMRGAATVRLARGNAQISKWASENIQLLGS